MGADNDVVPHTAEAQHGERGGTLQGGGGGTREGCHDQDLVRAAVRVDHQADQQDARGAFIFCRVHSSFFFYIYLTLSSLR